MKDWLVVFLITGFLINIFVGTTTMSTNMILSKLMLLFYPFLSFTEPLLLGRKERMHNKTQYFRSLRIHCLLHCVDISSKLHMLGADETPWKQRGLLIAFPLSRKVFGTLKGLAVILKNLLSNEVLCLHPVQCTGKVLYCHIYFSP